MNKLYRKINTYRSYPLKYHNRSKAYNVHHYKKRPMYKTILKQIAWCILIVLLIIVIKNINLPMTNKTSNMIKTTLHKELDIKKFAQEIRIYIKRMPQVTDKVVNAFNDFTNKKNINTVSFLSPANGMVISKYGESIDPVFETKTFQRGVDISVQKGTNIIAVASGEIVEVGEGQSLGKYIKIKHSHNVFSIYGHCSEIKVVKGQRVKQGDRIAVMNKNENQDISYLHFELWVDGKIVDPMKYIDFNRRNL